MQARAPRCRAALTEAIGKLLRRDGVACAGPAARTPACTRWARWRISTSAAPGRRTRCARRSTSTSSPTRSPSSTAPVVADDFDARFSATGAALPLPHPGAAGAAGARPRPGVVGPAADATSSRCTRRRGARRPARLHDLPRRRLPGQVADQDARSPGGDAPRRRDRHRRLGPLVPAQPGALDGRLAEAGRRRQVASRSICARLWRPATARPAAWSRRRGASISCASTMHPAAPRHRLPDIASRAPASHKGPAADVVESVDTQDLKS